MTNSNQKSKLQDGVMAVRRKHNSPNCLRKVLPHMRVECLAHELAILGPEHISAMRFVGSTHN